MLVISLPNHACMAMCAATVMRWRETINADRANAPAGKVVERGTADTADSDNDYVVTFHGGKCRRTQKGFARSLLPRSVGSWLGQARPASATSSRRGFRTTPSRCRSYRFAGL